MSVNVIREDNNAPHENISPVRVLICGLGIVFDRYIPKLLLLQEEDDVTIVGIVNEVCSYGSLNGWKIMDIGKIGDYEIDCILLAVESDQTKEAINKIRLLPFKTDIPIISSNLLEIYGFTFKKYMRLLKSRLSIVGCNCWGGLIYHHFGLKFLTPFINMWMNSGDLIRLVNNLSYYMKQGLILNRIEYESARHHNYPVYGLGDVELHMNHYSDAEYAKYKFEERARRLNYDNLLVMLFTDSHKVLENFHNITQKKKVCFVPFASDYPEAVHINEKWFNGDTPLWMLVNWSAEGKLPYLDLWDLLLDGRITKRMELGYSG